MDDNIVCEHAIVPIKILAPSEKLPHHDTILVDGKRCYGHDNCALGHIPNSTACRADMNQGSGS